MFEALSLKEQAVYSRAERLREQVDELDTDKQRRYYETYERSLKDPDTYAVLNWLACAGLHHFYLGKWVRGGVNLGVMLAGLSAFAFLGLAGLLPGGLLIGAVILVELPALFRSQVIVEEYNVSVGERVLRELSPARTSLRRI